MQQIRLPLEAKDIEQIIPHRPPFLLVDRIIELEILKSIKGIKNVSMNEPFFTGHFPGYPVMPGVLIIESLAQTAGILATLSLETEKNDLYFFASINNARFKKPVIPGDSLLLDIKLLNHRSGIGKFYGQAWVNQELVAEAEITCAKKKIS